MSRYLNQVTISDELAAAYRRDGFVKVAGLFTKEVLDKMRPLAVEKESVDFEPKGLATEALSNLGRLYKLAKNIGLDRETMIEICTDPIFIKVREQLSPIRWAYTMSLLTSLDIGTRGLNWHFGVDSFNFVGPDQDGITFWIPLDPIDPSQQGGGMAYVSEEVYSGRNTVKLLYQFISRYRTDANRLRDLFAFEKAYRQVAEPVLEENRVEDSFQPGDALIFNRHIYHRTSQLLPGPIATRHAFVLRFIDDTARYDPEFYRTMKAFAEMTGWFPPSKFGLSLADSGMQPGARVLDSPLVIPV